MHQFNHYLKVSDSAVACGQERCCYTTSVSAVHWKKTTVVAIKSFTNRAKQQSTWTEWKHKNRLPPLFLGNNWAACHNIITQWNIHPPGPLSIHLSTLSLITTVERKLKAPSEELSCSSVEKPDSSLETLGILTSKQISIQRHWRDGGSVLHIWAPWALYGCCWLSPPMQGIPSYHCLHPAVLTEPSGPYLHLAGGQRSDEYSEIFGRGLMLIQGK